MKNLLVCFPFSGASESAGGPRPDGGKPPTTVLPQVLKDELPSSVVLKYIEGVGKRSSKLIETLVEHW